MQSQMEKNKFELWCNRLGHVSAKRLLNMSNNDLVLGLNGILKDGVFMEQPQGFKDNVNPSLCAS